MKILVINWVLDLQPTVYLSSVMSICSEMNGHDMLHCSISESMFSQLCQSKNILLVHSLILRNACEENIR